MKTDSRGFTLLETVIALAILALTLMAIFDLNAGAVANHTYTKKLTVATLLARSKMEDLEQELHDKGFPNDDDEQSGDFSDEGWTQFKWRAKIIAPKTDDVSPDQLIGALFNLPVGDGSDLGNLASLFGGGGGDKDKGGSGGAAASPMQGAMMGAAQPMFTQMVSQIQRAVREVQLTVTWQEGTQVESLDLVTHVVSLGPGSDRNGGQAGAMGAPLGGVPGQPGQPGAMPGQPGAFPGQPGAFPGFPNGVPGGRPAFPGGGNLGPPPGNPFNRGELR